MHHLATFYQLIAFGSYVVSERRNTRISIGLERGINCAIPVGTDAQTPWGWKGRGGTSARAKRMGGWLLGLEVREFSPEGLLPRLRGAGLGQRKAQATGVAATCRAGALDRSEELLDFGFAQCVGERVGPRI